jgi:hypothetical protein
VILNLKRSLRDQPRPLYLLYHNPLLEHVLANSGFRRLSGTSQYCVYVNYAYKDDPDLTSSRHNAGLKNP